MDFRQITENGEKWKSPLDQYRGLVWTRILWRRAGFITPNQFARVVDGDSKYRQKWHNYFIGTRVPRLHAGRDPVEDAESLWPGTAQPFRSCVWSILAGQNVAGEALANEVARLGGDITFALLAGKGRHLWETGDEEKNAEEELMLLSEFPTFAGLQALIILLHRAEQLASPVLWNDIRACYRAMKPAFVRCGDIPFHRYVFAAVDRYARPKSLSDFKPSAARYLWHSAGAKFADEEDTRPALGFVPVCEARKCFEDPIYLHLRKMRLRDPTWKIEVSSSGSRISKNK